MFSSLKVRRSGIGRRFIYKTCVLSTFVTSCLMRARNPGTCTSRLRSFYMIGMPSVTLDFSPAREPSTLTLTSTLGGQTSELIQADGKTENNESPAHPDRGGGRGARVRSLAPQCRRNGVFVFVVYVWCRARSLRRTAHPPVGNPTRVEKEALRLFLPTAVCLVPHLFIFIN